MFLAHRGVCVFSIVNFILYFLAFNGTFIFSVVEDIIILSSIIHTFEFLHDKFGIILLTFLKNSLIAYVKQICNKKLESRFQRNHRKSVALMESLRIIFANTFLQHIRWPRPLSRFAVLFNVRSLLTF